MFSCSPVTTLAPKKVTLQMIPADRHFGFNRNLSVNWTPVTLIEIMSRLHRAGK
jgi:hypothetical protein